MLPYALMNSANSTSISNAIPVEIKIKDTKINKDIDWSIENITDAGYIAAPLRILGVPTKPIEQKDKVTYIVRFSDLTHKTIECSPEKLYLDLVIWFWRIANKKTEKDYVTFGIAFSKLQRGMSIPKNVIQKKLGIDKQDKSFFYINSEFKKIEEQLTKFIGIEIRRFFKDKRNDDVIISTYGEICIPTKSEENRNAIYGCLLLIPLILVFGGCVSSFIAGMNKSPEQIYKEQREWEIEKLEKRHGRGYCETTLC